MLLGNVKTLLKVMSKYKVPVATILWGPTGIGKSGIVKRFAKEIGYDLIDLRLSMREAVDILGMPYTSKDTLENRQGEKIEVNTLDHYSPKWFVQALLKGKTVLFLDELNRARPEVLQAVFQLALDRELNGIKLPDDVIIISACNPSDGKYDTIGFDPALIARFMHIQVRPDFESWLEWAREVVNNKTRIHPHVINYIIKFPEALHLRRKEDDEFPVEVEPHPRCWEFVSLIEDIPDSDLSDEVKKECAKGLVGNVHATAYTKEKTSVIKAISLEEVFKLDDAIKARIEILAGRDGRAEGRVRVDMLAVTCNEINDKEKLCRDHCEKVLDFLELMPGDLGIKTVKQIYNKDSKAPWADAIVKRPVLMNRFREMQKSQEATRAYPVEDNKPKKFEVSTNLKPRRKKKVS